MKLQSEAVVLVALAVGFTAMGMALVVDFTKHVAPAPPPVARPLIHGPEIVVTAPTEETPPVVPAPATVPVTVPARLRAIASPEPVVPPASPAPSGT